MNPGVLSVRNSRVVFVAMLFVLIGGVVAYRQMGRLEDPEFTIKEAQIITPYPGASAEEVAQEVTNRIENACQQLGQLKRIESESSRGRSVVSAIIQDRYHRDAIPQVWDELRRKIHDAQPLLPPSVPLRCGASRSWSTISAPSTASSSRSPARATRNPSCGGTPSSSAVSSSCWRTSKRSNSSANSRKSPSSRSPGSGWRGSGSTRK